MFDSQIRATTLHNWRRSSANDLEFSFFRLGITSIQEQLRSFLMALTFSKWWILFIAFYPHMNFSLTITSAFYIWMNIDHRAVDSNPGLDLWHILKWFSLYLIILAIWSFSIENACLFWTFQWPSADIVSAIVVCSKWVCFDISNSPHLNNRNCFADIYDNSS